MCEPSRQQSRTRRIHNSFDRRGIDHTTLREDLAAAAFAANGREQLAQQGAHVAIDPCGLRENDSFRRAARQDHLYARRGHDLGSEQGQIIRGSIIKNKSDNSSFPV